MEYVYEKGVTYGKNTNQYKIFANIVSNNSKYEYALPYFSLFDTEEYVEVILCNSRKKVKYDKDIECFIFTDFSECFYFCADSFKLLYENFPEDSDIEKKYNVFKTSMKMINAYIEFDEVYCKMCDLKL